VIVERRSMTMNNDQRRSVGHLNYSKSSNVLENAACIFCVVLINEEMIGYKFTYATELEENVYFTVTVTNIYRALIV